MTEAREKARALAEAAHARGDATGWLEELYAGAAGDESAIPWADGKANPNLVAWLDTRAAHGGRALVVGCGLGDDAEELARRGYDVTAFDVAPSAIDWCGRRFAGSAVSYVVADLLHAPAEWAQAFDLVVESYTVQVLRGEARREALLALPGFVAPGGTLLLIARARTADEPEGTMPWPLERHELSGLAQLGMSTVHVEEYDDPADPGARRLRAEFTRPA